MFKEPTLRHNKFNRIYYVLVFKGDGSKDISKNFREKSILFKERFKYVPYHFKNGDVNRLLFNRNLNTLKDTFLFMFTDNDIINREKGYGRKLIL